MMNMDKKKIIFYSAAALCCVLITVIAATGNYSDADILYRDENGPFTVDFQTDNGTYLSAVMDSQDAVPPVSAADTPAAEYTVNINTATAFELEALLPGIGEKKAAAIAEYRAITGGFRSVDELIEVDGISPALLEKLRPYCRLNDDGIQD